MHKNGAGFIMLTIPSVDKNPQRFGRAALLDNRQEPKHANAAFAASAFLPAGGRITA